MKLSETPILDQLRFKRALRIRSRLWKHWVEEDELPIYFQRMFYLLKEKDDEIAKLQRKIESLKKGA